MNKKKDIELYRADVLADLIKAGYSSRTYIYGRVASVPIFVEEVENSESKKALEEIAEIIKKFTYQMTK